MDNVTLIRIVAGTEDRPTPWKHLALPVPAVTGVPGGSVQITTSGPAPVTYVPAAVKPPAAAVSAVVKSSAPIAPATVLFGLVFGTSLRRPSVLPTI